MPEDVTSDLTVFTPVVPDRDALLFAAGKAAARQWAGWKWLTAALVLSNAVTLTVLLWPRPEQHPPLESPLQQPTVMPIVLPSSPLTPEPFSYFALSQGWSTPTVADNGPPAEQIPLTLRAIYDSTIP